MQKLLQNFPGENINLHLTVKYGVLGYEESIMYSADGEQEVQHESLSR